MNEKNLKQQFIDWASQQNEICQLVYTGNRANKAAVQTDTDPYEWIISMKQPEDYPTKLSWDDFPIGEIYEKFYMSRNGVPSMRILLKELVRIDMYFLTENQLEEWMNKYSLCEIIFDKTNRFPEVKAPTDLSLRIRKPSKEQFDQWCQLFFKEITDVCFALKDKDMLPAQFALARARTPLYKMVLASVSSKRDYTLNPGLDGKNLKTYVEEEHMDSLFRSFSKTSTAELWDAVFQSCMLFRHMGLSLAEKCDYEYPKKMDVQLLKLFREIWEESR